MRTSKFVLAIGITIIFLAGAGCLKLWFASRPKKLEPKKISQEQTYKLRESSKNLKYPTSSVPYEIFFNDRSPLYHTIFPLYPEYLKESKTNASIEEVPVPGYSNNPYEVEQEMGEDFKPGFIELVSGHFEHEYPLRTGKVIKNKSSGGLLSILILRYKDSLLAQRVYSKVSSSRLKEKGYELKGNEQEMYAQYKILKKKVIEELRKKKKISERNFHFEALPGKWKKNFIRGIEMIEYTYYVDTGKANPPFQIGKEYFFRIGDYLFSIVGTSQEAVNDALGRVVEAFGTF